MMSGKIKGFSLDSKAAVEDVKKARLKHRSLIQDCEELQKEVNAMRSRLEAAKNKKLILAAEVRFLRRRRRCLVETNSAAHSAQEQLQEHGSTPLHQTERTKKGPTKTTKEAAARSKRTLPSGLLSNPKKQREVNRARKVAISGAKEHNFAQIHSVPMSDLTNHRESRTLNSLDLNHNPPSVKAPTFDLNEISTGDDANGGLELESSKSVLGVEHQNDLKLSSISRVGKRKISWQDPLALRVV